MHEEAFVTVDEGNAGADGRSVEVGGIEDTDAVDCVVEVDAIGGCGSDALERFEGGRGDRVMGYGDCDGFASAVVSYCDGFMALGGAV